MVRLYDNQMAQTHCCRRFFFKGKAITPANTSLPRQLSLSPPPPPPDFAQCMIGSSHFLPMPFPTHRLASQQNSENMATEKNKIAAAVEEATLIQMNCYPHGWREVSKNQNKEDSNCPQSGEISCPKVQNGRPDGLLLYQNGGFCQKDKRRLSKTSGTSSGKSSGKSSGTSNRTRVDDLSV